MITRLSKIARLPAHIREELNRRLHDGELSRTIIPWVNELPETKKVMADLYRGKPVTHQNLSEWRHTGYQDWLFHQQRLEWNRRLGEEEAEVTEQNRCEDGYEAMGFQFLYDISQALKAMRQIKNQDQRWNRLETLAREFSRLQNAFNWSRRVGLEFDKFNCSGTGVSPVSSCSHRQDARATKLADPVTERECGAGIPACGFSGLSSPESKSPPVPHSLIPKLLNFENLPPTAALQDAPRNPEASAERASVLDCRSPLPLSAENSKSSEPTAMGNAGGASVPASRSDIAASAQEIPEPSKTSSPNSQTPNPLNSSTPTKSQPLPPLAPPTPPRPFKVSHIPVRGRRFICIEG
jgi:hypothetical protein